MSTMRRADDLVPGDRQCYRQLTDLGPGGVVVPRVREVVSARGFLNRHGRERVRVEWSDGSGSTYRPSDLVPVDASREDGE